MNRPWRGHTILYPLAVGTPLRLEIDHSASIYRGFLRPMGLEATVMDRFASMLISGRFHGDLPVLFDNPFRRAALARLLLPYASTFLAWNRSTDSGQE